MSRLSRWSNWLIDWAVAGLTGDRCQVCERKRITVFIASVQHQPVNKKMCLACGLALIGALR